MEEQNQYNRPSIRLVFNEDDNDPDVIELRSSAINSCPRQLWYTLMGETVSDEVPVRNQRMLNMGNALEGVVGQTLKDQGHTLRPGWEIIPEGSPILRHPMGKLDDKLEWQITGLPDFLVRHKEDLTGYMMVEVKSRSADAFRRVVNEGNLSAQPGAVMQLAAYRLAPDLEMTLSQPGPLNDDSAIVTMNRSDGDLHQEYFTLDTLKEVLEQVKTQWRSRLSGWLNGDEPERLKPNHWQCQSCVFRTVCGNLVEDVSPMEQDKGIPVDDEEFADALHHFCSWKEQEALNSMPKAVKETWDSVGLRYFMRHGIDKLNGVENGEGVWNISLQDSGRETLNVEKVRYYLPPSIFQECFEKKPGKPYLVVRKARSKKGA